MIFEIFCKIFLNKIKTSISSTFISNGASEENRTPISTLARSHINHYTTPAYKYSIKKKYDLQVYFKFITWYNY